MGANTLLIPAKGDIERDRVAEVWQAEFGPVLRVARFWDRPDVDPSAVRLYGNDTFCLVLADILGLELVSPPDDLLIGLDRKWLHREVASTVLSEIDSIDFPMFVKPLVPKQFRAGVFEDSEALRQETAGLDGSTLVQTSEVVSIDAEARCFVLDGRAATAAFYEGSGDPDAVGRLVDELAQEAELPATVVIDVGLIDGELAVIEANATWGAGLNGCDPRAATPCIESAVRSPGHR